MPRRKKEIKMRGYVPLSGLFMATAIVGFIISLFWIYPENLPWGFTFLLFFTLMLVASFISMTHAVPVTEEAFRKKK